MDMVKVFRIIERRFDPAANPPCSGTCDTLVPEVEVGTQVLK
jgi:hypothetical protein